MRQPKPYWKKSHACWYVNINGKPVRLDPDEAKAQTLYYERMAGTRDVAPDMLVLELILRFLEWSKANQSAGTFAQRDRHLKSFSVWLASKGKGKLKVRDLKPDHVEDWITDRFKKAKPKDSRERQTNNGSTLHTAIRNVQRVFNWAVKRGRLDKSPLAGMVKPTPTTRDVYLMPDQFKEIVAAIADENFLDFVVTMRETGCRPKEIRDVEARHFDKASRCWNFPREEAKGKREPRTVLLNDKAFEICQKRALRYPAGPLFRNQDGNLWTKNAVGLRCERLAKRLKFPICAYAIRHTFATDAIIRGVDLVTIAQLMGHKDLEMLQRIYQHVKKRGDHLRDALKKATEDAA
jgi:integrase